MVNVEQILIDYLIPLLPGVTIAADVPNPRPEKLVTIERTGGGADSIVLDRPALMVQCWAKSRVEASNLAYEVDALILDIDHADICKIDRTGLYNFPDEKGNPRYQITYSAVAYRQEVDK